MAAAASPRPLELRALSTAAAASQADFASHFRSEGHATAASGVWAPSIRVAACDALYQEAVESLAAQQGPTQWTKASFWRRLAMRFKFNLFEPDATDLASIRSGYRRHIVLLASSPSLDEALIVLAEVASAAGLPNEASLVELSAVLTLQGAQAQSEHSDISPLTPDVVCLPRSSSSLVAAVVEPALTSAPLVTCWLALGRSGVTVDMGPTTVLPRSHIRFRQRLEDLDSVAAAELQAAWLSHSSDGEDTLASLCAEGNTASQEAMLQLKEAAQDAASARELTQFGPPPSAVSLLLAQGDVGIMDCRVTHQGSAHGGGDTRVVLNATWAAAGVDGADLKGFTYHAAAHERGVRTIGSILLAAGAA